MTQPEETPEATEYPNSATQIAPGLVEETAAEKEAREAEEAAAEE